MTADFETRWRPRLTIPNALSLFRILAAPVLVGLAAADRRFAVMALFMVMSVSDWLDGKLAVLLDQRSDVGPRFDSIADLSMYGALIVSLILLDGERLVPERPWLAAPFALYLVAGGLSLAKFGRWPHHHTRMAKISWGLMLVGAIVFLGEWSPWPLRLALVGAALASVQSIRITRTLPKWRADVPSPAAARAIRREAEEDRAG